MNTARRHAARLLAGAALGALVFGPVIDVGAAGAANTYAFDHIERLVTTGFHDDGPADGFLGNTRAVALDFRKVGHAVAVSGWSMDLFCEPGESIENETWGDEDEGVCDVLRYTDVSASTVRVAMHPTRLDTARVTGTIRFSDPSTGVVAGSLPIDVVVDGFGPVTDVVGYDPVHGAHSVHTFEHYREGTLQGTLGSAVLGDGPDDMTFGGLGSVAVWLRVP